MCPAVKPCEASVSQVCFSPNATCSLGVDGELDGESEKRGRQRHKGKLLSSQQDLDPPLDLFPGQQNTDHIGV